MILSLIVGMTASAFLCAALIGACLGFLKFNHHPASIFMGDCGALTLGFVLGVVSLLAVAKSTILIALLVPILSAGIPVLELMYPVDLSGCLPGLLLVILGGGLYAVGIILYYVDTVMRRQTALCLAYLLAVVITLPLPYLLVKHGGLMGACTAFALEMVILVAVLAADLMMAWRKVKKGGARA